ncbi:MAG: DUF5131 family protein [Thermoleophilia bacterium]|nr:DUF5131 family protein [Thermoleophilia bacterium]
MTKIEWCDNTINPLGWGCYGPGGNKENPKPCPYCYARRASRGPWAAQRGCPDCMAFRPHWHPEMLEKPLKWRKPRRIFVQSMGDLFHPETPQEHIEAVLKTVRACPQHTFIFLTKNPARYPLFHFPFNCMIGATATSQESWDHAIKVLGLTQAGHLYRFGYPVNTFISAEPLLGPIEPGGMHALSWLIIGAERWKSVVPERRWIMSLLTSARRSGAAVFMKDNLSGLAPLGRDPEGKPYLCREFPKEVSNG